MILSRSAAARSNSSFSAASSISASSAARSSSDASVTSSRPAASRAIARAWISSSMPRRIALTIDSGVIPCSRLYSSCFSRRRFVSSMARCIDGVTLSA